MPTTFTYGSLTGPAQAVRHTPGVSAHELGATFHRHFTVEKVDRGIADVIKAYLELEITKAWGDARSVAADGAQWDTVLDNLPAERHIRHSVYGEIAYHPVADNSCKKIREIPLHPTLRGALADWLDKREDWLGANTPAPSSTSPAAGCRSKARTTSSPQSPPRATSSTAHTLRQTFATGLVRGRVDLITVAELLGHAASKPPPRPQERAAALKLLDVDL